MNCSLAHARILDDSRGVRSPVQVKTRHARADFADTASRRNYFAALALKAAIWVLISFAALSLACCFAAILTRATCCSEASNGVLALAAACFLASRSSEMHCW